jgi:CRISPR-associated protein Cmr1
MKKQLPPLPPVVVQPQEKVITQRREYQLITPLFGGGVEPSEADPITAIRGPGVRGQLRFWWRACRGGRFDGDLREMKRHEDKLWGSTDGPSQVQIAVTSTPGRPLREVPRPQGDRIHIGAPASPYGYVAFPLNDKPRASVMEGITFTLTITFCDTDKAEVEAALWAWETFGGVGARTRRGFGALRLTKIDGDPNRDVPPANQQGVEQWLRTKLTQHVVEGRWPDKVPHIPQNTSMVSVTRSSGSADDAWKTLIKALKNFRQERPPNRGPNGNQRPGRNRWPEADTIRALVGQSHPRHATPVTRVRKFPRAAFGLPLNFQFKDGDKYGNANGDPRKTALQLAHHDRLASPLVLRPLACQDGQAYGLALVLQGTGLSKEVLAQEQLVLSTQEGPRGRWLIDKDDVHLMVEEAAALTKKDGQPLLGNTSDVIVAFLSIVRRS